MVNYTYSSWSYIDPKTIGSANLFAYLNEKSIPVFSDIAESAYSAEINGQKWEGGKNWWRNIFYLGLGLLGI